MLSMSAILRRLHRILLKEHNPKAIKHPDNAPAPQAAEITVITTPFVFNPLERAETTPAPQAHGWKRRLSARKTDAATARAARDKAAQSHYVLRRSTVLFPEMSDEKWEAQLYAHQNRSMHALPMATVHFSAQVMEIPPPAVTESTHPATVEAAPARPTARVRSLSTRPKRKPVPSLYMLDPDGAPMLTPLPPSPMLSACQELEDGELAELAV